MCFKGKLVQVNIELAIVKVPAVTLRAHWMRPPELLAQLMATPVGQAAAVPHPSCLAILCKSRLRVPARHALLHLLAKDNGTHWEILY